jgi:hypothetical protein
LIRFAALCAVLGLALAVMLLAGRRRWQPTALVAVAIALVLRGVVLGLAAGNGWQPYDFINDFTAAGTAVLHGQDPLVAVRDGGWHFLPPMAYAFAGELKLGQLLGLPWTVLGRILPVAADTVNVWLVGLLVTTRAAAGRPTRAAAGGRPAGPAAGGRFTRAAADGRPAGPGLPATARLQYACNPIGIMVSAIHGQIEPVALAFGLAALVLARRGRPVAAGLAVGAAIAINTWPVLIVPGVVLAISGWRPRLVSLALGAAVPAAFFLTIPLAAGGGVSGLRAAVAQLGIRPVTGEWGWGAIVDLLRGSGGALVVSPTLGYLGNLAILLALAAIFVAWRRADPVDLVAALLIGFLVTTTRFGAQYLLWPAPFLNARPSYRSDFALAIASLWAATGYLYLTMLPQNTYWAAHGPWSVASIVVIGSLALVLFARRPRGMAPWSTDTPRQSSPVLAD